MKEPLNFLAVDLGAASGRVLLGQWDGHHFEIQDLYRFSNGPVSVFGHLHWDLLRLWSEIKNGLTRYAAHYDQPLAGIGIDTWGVDYVLLDRSGQLLGNPYHYRDSRTDGIFERAFQIAPRSWIYQHTGIQFLQFNTLFQLFSSLHTNDPQLQLADTVLMMPDCLHYWLTGEKASEYTIASTSQLLDGRARNWDGELLARFNLPVQIFPDIVPPGTILGDLIPEVIAETGLRQPVPVITPGSHDTASAVAAIPDLDRNSVYISSGTWSLMGLELGEPLIDDQALALNFTNEGGVGETIRFLKNVAGLWLLQESRRQWQIEGHDFQWDDLLNLAESASPFRSLVDPDAPDFLSPGDMPDKIRAYCRAHGQPEPESVGAVVRCCLESLALKYRWVLESLKTLTDRPLEKIRVVGGGSLNRLLCQFTADACALPVVAGPVEATALGNLMIQVIAAGGLKDIHEGRQAVAASIERRTYSPAPALDWLEAYERFLHLISG
jgi:rhamnulokinase